MQVWQLQEHMTAVQAAENHGDEWGLTWYLRWGTYTSTRTWTHSQNSLAAADAPISTRGTSNDHESHPNQHENSHKLCDEMWHSLFSLAQSQWKTKTNTRSEFPNEGKTIVEQVLASEEKNKSKRAWLWKSESGIRVGKLTIWVRSFEIITEFSRSISSTRIG